MQFNPPATNPNCLHVFKTNITHQIVHIYKLEQEQYYKDRSEKHSQYVWETVDTSHCKVLRKCLPTESNTLIGILQDVLHNVKQSHVFDKCTVITDILQISGISEKVSHTREE